MKRIFQFVFFLVLAVESICAAELPAVTARRLLASGKTDQAAKLLLEHLKVCPSDYESRVLLSTTLAVQGFRSNSIQQMELAVKLRPGSAQAYNLMGITLSRFQELEDAKRAFEHAIQLDPQLAEAHVNLSLILAQKSNWESAGLHLDRALSIEDGSPASGYSHYLRAMVFVEQTDFQNAGEQLKQSVLIRPDFADAWSELGWVCGTLTDDQGSINALTRAIRLNPDDPITQFRIGTAYLRQGNLDLAVLHLRVAYRLSPNDRSILYNLGRALRKAGHVQEANNIALCVKDQLQSSHYSSENKTQIALLSNQGIRLEKEGDIQGASEKYRIALELDPTADTIRLNYGLALCRIQHWKKGVDEIQEVLRLDPNNGDAMKALYIARDLERAGVKEDPTR